MAAATRSRPSGSSRRYSSEYISGLGCTSSTRIVVTPPREDFHAAYGNPARTASSCRACRSLSPRPRRKNYPFRCNAYTTSVHRLTPAPRSGIPRISLTDRNAELPRILVDPLRLAPRLPMDAEIQRHGHDRAERRRGDGGTRSAAAGRSLRDEPRGPGRRAPRQRLHRRDGGGQLGGHPKGRRRRVRSGHHRSGPAAGSRDRGGRLGPGAHPARRGPGAPDGPHRRRMPPRHAGGGAALRRRPPARETHQPARAAEHRPQSAPGDHPRMKRASIGLGILVTFFILAMFLMADAEVTPVDDPALISASAPAR